MSHQRQRYVLLCLAISLGLLLAWLVVQAAPAAVAARLDSASQPVTTPTIIPGQPDTRAPDISIIDGPTPACVLPRPGTDTCYLTWAYLQASADPASYIISMTVEIDGQGRGRYQGFFQTAMYIPTELLSFRVSCGVPGAGGNPDWGLSHSYVVRGRDTSGLKAANYGSVFCPADQVSLVSASLDGPAQGRYGRPNTFTAAVTPLTATLPITYTWLADDHPPQVQVNGTAGISRAFAWNSYGLKTVQLTISNPVSELVLSDTILIEPYSIYSPLIRRSP